MSLLGIAIIAWSFCAGVVAAAMLDGAGGCHDARGHWHPEG